MTANYAPIRYFATHGVLRITHDEAPGKTDREGHKHGAETGQFVGKGGGAGAGSAKKGKTPPFGAAQNRKNVDNLLKLDPHPQLESVMKRDKQMGYKVERYMVSAPKDRAQWPLHTLGFRGRPPVPPDAKNVVISPDEDGPLWASYDPSNGGGRKHIYNLNYSATKQAVKAARVSNFIAAAPKIAKQLDVALKATKGKDAVHAMVYNLILQTGIRVGTPGNTTANVMERVNGQSTGKVLKKGEPTYGATTLEGRHVKQRKDGVYLEFLGKMGHEQDVLVGKQMGAVLLKRAQAAGAKGAIFPEITAGSLRSWQKDVIGDYKVHDVRMAKGTTQAKEMLASLPVPKTEKEWKEAFKFVGTEVAKTLGNTREASLNSYIHIDVWKPWVKFEDKKRMDQLRARYNEMKED